VAPNNSIQDRSWGADWSGRSHGCKIIIILFG
jgi:hypothetical protein